VVPGGWRWACRNRKIQRDLALGAEVSAPGTRRRWTLDGWPWEPSSTPTKAGIACCSSEKPTPNSVTIRKNPLLATPASDCKRKIHIFLKCLFVKCLCRRIAERGERPGGGEEGVGKNLAKPQKSLRPCPAIPSAETGGVGEVGPADCD
jgi:hypothetical protein